MRSAARFCVVLASALFLGGAAYAASISGVVKGPDGAPFMGAFVEAQNSQTRITTNVLTDRQGHYRMENLPAGQYRVQIRAVGHRADAHSGLSLAAGQNTSLDFALQKGMVRWSDLNTYQGKKLLPDSPGKQVLTQNCFICHSFQTRMAAVTRDQDGWQDRINYMRTAMRFALSSRIDDQKAGELVSYLTSIFGPDSTLPKSPSELPAYKETLRSFSDEAMRIVYVEYDLPGPNRMPWSAAPDKDGNLWMPYYGRGNTVARLNPATAEVKEFRVPVDDTAGVHSAFPAPDGTVWFSEFALDKIGHLDPQTGKIDQYQDSGAVPDGMGGEERAGKHTIRVDLQGNIWSSGSPLTKFDPRTQKFTHYMEVPTSYGITLDKEGNIWFTVLRKDGHIGRVDGKTGKLTQWSPPTQGTPQRIQVDGNGFVWFSERSGNKLGRFDPKTETFKEFQLPGPDASPYPVGLDPQGYLWYGSTDQDTFGRLDPATGQVVEYPVPHSENLSREFFLDAQGRMWYASPTNNRVGYFYLPGWERASK